mgnify:CR=1 FL=1|jgi:hypothetical protein|tara:strand:- start:3570 stop:4280 length:711 start_codon:yes stop_codon:yes gene_type:complete
MERFKLFLEELGEKHINPDGKRAHSKLRAKEEIRKDISFAISQLKKTIKEHDIKIVKSKDASQIRWKKDGTTQIELANRGGAVNDWFPKLEHYRLTLYTLAHEFGHSYQNENRGANLFSYLGKSGHHPASSSKGTVRLITLAKDMVEDVNMENDNATKQELETSMVTAVNTFHGELAAWEMGQDYIPSILRTNYIKVASRAISAYINHLFTKKGVSEDLVRSIDPELYDKYKFTRG